MKKIGELLVENSLLTPEDLKRALEIQKDQEVKEPIGEILISMGVITIQVLTEYLSIQMRKYGN
ncbi:MAG: hypothetical protein JXB03_09110 [Spirochaetales bacterium]|nr:hypothetical protein [Spirochaetales bacterium]